MKLRSVIVLIIFVMLSACSSSIDAKNPEHVAKEFINHVRLKQYKQAMQYVILEDRVKFNIIQFERELSRLPPIPANPKILIKKLTKTTGHFNVTNWTKKAEIELRFKSNRWWIKK